jgi:glycerate 2-kinase
MAAAATNSVLRSLHEIVGGVMVTPELAPAPYPTITAVQGDHPVPGRRSFAAAARIGEVAGGRRSNEVALVLVSGGTSSLIAGPLRGQSEGDLSALYQMLLESGLDIGQMNAIRKRFTRWGGGRLALALAPAATHCLVVSDVIGDDLSAIGSGPCVPDPLRVGDVTAALQRAGLYTRISQTYRDHLTGIMRGLNPETPKATHPAFAHITARVIATNRLALDAIASQARARGFVTEVRPVALAGEASVAGADIARQLIEGRTGRVSGAGGRQCIVWGGETTVALRGGGASVGAGGRCQELALAAARALAAGGESARGISLLAAGTDGRDGATEAAGACVDHETWNTIRAAGRDPDAALSRHESYGALSAAGALIPRRVTGTNVMDVVVGLMS